MPKTRRLIAVLVAVLSYMGCLAEDTDSLGLTAAKCFTSAPTTVLTMLDNNTRLDMLDYFHAGVQRPSANSIGGECFITSESPYKLTLASGTGIEYEIFVLNPMATCPIIGVIETLDTPIPDNALKLYDCRWRPLTQATPAPVLKDWLRPDAAKARADVEFEMPFIMATCTYDPDASQLIFTNVMQQYFLPTDTPASLGRLKDSLKYSWNGKQFKLNK